MKDCGEFYRLRDRRSIEYLGREIDDQVPVHVVIDAASAGTAAGQLAFLALANQLVRITRRVSFGINDPNVKVVVRTPFEGEILGEVLRKTVSAIDPCGEFAIGERTEAHRVTIGLGEAVDCDCDWYVGADCSIAYLQRTPVGFTRHAGTVRGGALASCLGCAAMLREQLGMPVAARALSAWNYGEDAAADVGPSSLDTMNIGRVLMVGAGAVGSALAFWLNAFNCRADGWTIVDGDVVELHNTNRALTFTASDAGWPMGRPRKKASLLASQMPGASSCDDWYHDAVDLAEQKYDVVLALANDHDIRERLTHRSPVLAFQATTGENWLSQLHRHILGRDGCIWCRTGQVKSPSYGCSSGVVEAADGQRSDAALPFLSGASGLMLMTALQRLSEGSLLAEVLNTWSWDFASQHRMAMRPEVRQCRTGCALVLPAEVRRKINAGGKWAGLDGSPIAASG